jgi:hypothetical protein
VRGLSRRAKEFLRLELTQVDILVVGSERKLAPMTVSSPNAIEIKLDRVIGEMRFLRSQMIAFDRYLKGLEASLKPSEPSEQQPETTGLRSAAYTPSGDLLPPSPPAEKATATRSR